MPRRTLLALTALVLALHWLVLHGIPLAWEGPSPPAGKVFSTRSVAARPVAPPAPPAPTTPVPTPAPARPQPASKAPPTPLAPHPAAAPAQVAETAPAMDPAQPPDAAAPETPQETPTDTATASAAPPEPAVAEPHPTPPEPVAPPQAPAPQAPTPLAAQSPGAAGGIDITAPGDDASQATSTAPAPILLPAPTRIAFHVTGMVKKLDYQARAELLWQHDGARYEARQNISVFLMGSRTQRSTGMVTGQGLQPERFSDRNRSERTAHFDYDKGRATFSANAPEAAIGPGTQDRLSVTIQLAAMVAAAPSRFVPGTRITLTTVGDLSADRWSFEVQALQTMDMAGTSTPVLKLRRLPRREPDQQLELWLAPRLGYLPARIKLTQSNGDTVDLQATEASPP